jgi:hypothetical protein
MNTMFYQQIDELPAIIPDEQEIQIVKVPFKSRFNIKNPPIVNIQNPIKLPLKCYFNERDPLTGNILNPIEINPKSRFVIRG